DIITHLLQQGQEPLPGAGQPRLPATGDGRSGVHHHAAGTDVRGAQQCVFQRTHRLTGGLLVGGTQVDQVGGVHEHRKIGALAHHRILCRITVVDGPSPRVGGEHLEGLGADLVRVGQALGGHATRDRNVCADRGQGPRLFCVVHRRTSLGPVHRVVGCGDPRLQPWGGSQGRPVPGRGRSRSSVSSFGSSQSTVTCPWSGSSRSSASGIRVVVCLLCAIGTTVSSRPCTTRKGAATEDGSKAQGLLWIQARWEYPPIPCRNASLVAEANHGTWCSANSFRSGSGRGALLLGNPDPSSPKVRTAHSRAESPSG